MFQCRKTVYKYIENFVLEEFILHISWKKVANALLGMYTETRRTILFAIYVVDSKALVTFSCGTFDSFQPDIECTMH